jgi:hypothetical protein
MNAYMKGLKETNPELFHSIISKIVNPVVLKT